MWMEKFDRSVWVLHRKLHHRYLRYSEDFQSATEDLPSYIDAVEADEPVEPRRRKKKSTETEVDDPSDQFISVLSESDSESS